MCASFPLEQYEPKNHRIHRQTLGKLIGLIISCLVLLMLLMAIPAHAESMASAPIGNETITSESMVNPNAEDLFELHCAGCHANGGNIIRRGKNLKKRAMMRNGYGEVEAISQIIRQGKGAMTAFADRLSEEEVNAIANYVHNKAQTGW